MATTVSWLLRGGLLLLSLSSLEPKVFVERREATRVLGGRRPRANSFLEEIMPGNLERECYEEICSQEEAAEIFQSQEKTMEFWYKYTNLNHCQYNLCLNGALCSMERGENVCLCPPRYSGKFCETEVFECQYKNGGCLHYCSDGPGQEASQVECSCADGYQLEPDGKSCTVAVPYPCGKQASQFARSRSLDDVSPLNDADLEVTHNSNSSRLHHQNATITQLRNGSSLLPQNHTHMWGNESLEAISQLEEGSDKRIVGGQLQQQGRSPWQVLLRRKDEYGYCGGTLISLRWVVTAAHCLQEKPDHVTIGDYDKMRPDPGEQKINVEKMVLHPHFHDYTFDSDIALLYLSAPVELGPYASPVCLPNAHLAAILMRPDIPGQVTGWGATRHLGRSSRFLRKVVLPVVEQQKCIKSTEHAITDNMFCAGYLSLERDACTGDSGGPFVVNYRGTWFLVGVVSWGERCAAEGKYGVYTRVSNYLAWIRDEVRKQQQKEDERNNKMDSSAVNGTDTL